MQIRVSGEAHYRPLGVHPNCQLFVIQAWPPPRGCSVLITAPYPNAAGLKKDARSPQGHAFSAIENRGWIRVSESYYYYYFTVNTMYLMLILCVLSRASCCGE